MAAEDARLEMPMDRPSSSEFFRSFPFSRARHGALAVLALLVASCATGPIPSIQPVSEPEMVMIPSGEYVMGDQSMAGSDDERPAHLVKLASFSISLTEITAIQFDVFQRESGRLTGDAEAASRMPEMPAAQVTWQDAMEYTRWLSRRTGKDYRLPSEAQWEYAARSGAAGRYLGGNSAVEQCRFGNFADITANRAGAAPEFTNCVDGNSGPSVVGRYAPNSFGLRDVMGNVWEWTLDCYIPTYEGAPSDGTASGADDPGCAKRVIRGGSYRLPVESSRLSNREAMAEDKRSEQIGFRVVLLQ